MKRFKMTAATLGLLSAYFVPSLRADESNKETRVSINGPLQVQDTLLEPGQYVFQLTLPDTSRTVVNIYNADKTRLEGTIMGWSAYRVDAGDKTLFHISQSQGNQPAKLQTWFYPGDNFGVEFGLTKNTRPTGGVIKSTGQEPSTAASADASGTHD